MQRFVIGLWTEKDIDMFHYNAKQYAIMGDATGSIAAKVGIKIILYYSFLLCDKTRNSEPLANIEILIDSQYELPIRHCLNQFILDEKRQFGHNCNTAPLLFTCDMSWPILKSATRCFNNESVEEYLSWSYRISNGRAFSSDLHIKPSKLFLHFCLSHMMHAFSRRLGKYFTGRKKRFIMYCCSVLANSKKWSIFRRNIYSIFILLLSCYKTDQTRLHFERLTCKIKELGKAENSNNYLIDDGNLRSENSEFKANLLLDFESNHKEKHYQQSKRSMYYQDCLEDFKNAKKNSKTRNTELEKNDLYCPQFGGYLLDNWTGLASLWSNMHLRDQIKHSKEKACLEWSKAFSEKACVIDPPRTQGIIEVHQKITKHITLASKKQRVGSVVADLKLKKISSHRSYEINTSRITKSAKLASENYNKRKKT